VPDALPKLTTQNFEQYIPANKLPLVEKLKK
jgi:hypothetical protein